MKNKLVYLMSGSVIIGSLLLGGTAFAATTAVAPTPPVQGQGGWGGGMRNGMKPAVFGTVSAVSGNTITVTSKMMGPKGSTTSTAVPTTTTYTVDASAATVTKANAASTVANIAVGDTVVVEGTVSGTNVAATAIHDGVMPMGGPREGQRGAPGEKPGMGTTTPIITGNGEPVIGGSVTAVSGSTLTVTNKSNVTYMVDATNAVIQKGNAKGTLSDVVVGDNVVVQGTVNGTAVVASSVADSGAKPAAGAPGSDTQGGPKGFVGGVVGAIGGFFHSLFGFF